MDAALRGGEEQGSDQAALAQPSCLPRELLGGPQAWPCCWPAAWCPGRSSWPPALLPRKPALPCSLTVETLGLWPGEPLAWAPGPRFP